MNLKHLFSFVACMYVVSDVDLWPYKNPEKAENL